MTPGQPLDARPDAHLDPQRLPGVQRFPGRAVDLFIARAFLPPDDCAALIARIDAARRPSTIADSNGDAAFRTSETCDLDGADPFIADINRRLSAFIGIDPAHGEPLQGQRYAVGQEFKAHTDYFEPGGIDYPRYCTLSGNRTWTLMAYLNLPQAGGATRFPRLGKSIQPEPGKLLCWNNRRTGGGVNPDTLHHGIKVRAGTKYIITKWFREKPWVG
ncbi:2OG-Fe(II) oxygenase [Sphingobium sufflavum]|uniref:prolyl hydroxylase family protein n=1 Tax=Sphingobium sufflavum TaxID=1129547 RepID=UPI001F38ECA9|nr:2OG-Fe(II) oxygenase [Sphingobium sufflavum]MCE7797508.1 2OG-Fe(II) oxygenase [Sphingobium sufflavum]